jgi:excisionase family DNA binding protein
VEKLLSAQQVADYLGIHVKTLYRQIRENTIALNFVQLGRLIAFRPAAVEKYIETHEIRRDGLGKQRVSKTKSRHRQIMTDEEAQLFFEGVLRDADGALLSKDAES